MPRNGISIDLVDSKIHDCIIFHIKVFFNENLSCSSLNYITDLFTNRAFQLQLTNQACIITDNSPQNYWVYVCTYTLNCKHVPSSSIDERTPSLSPPPTFSAVWDYKFIAQLRLSKPGARALWNWAVGVLPEDFTVLEASLLCVYLWIVNNVEKSTEMKVYLRWNDERMQTVAWL